MIDNGETKAGMAETVRSMADALMEQAEKTEGAFRREQLFAEAFHGFGVAIDLYSEAMRAPDASPEFQEMYEDYRSETSRRYREAATRLSDAFSEVCKETAARVAAVD